MSAASVDVQKEESTESTLVETSVDDSVTVPEKSRKKKTRVLPDYPTLKVVQNKTHMGPVPDWRKNRSGRLSKAANKIRLNCDLKVVVSSESSEDDHIQPKKVNPSLSREFTRSGNPEVDPVSAAYFMQVWDSVYPGAGDQEYVNKSTELIKAQREAYEELGINPDSKKKPELTEEQRSIYNALVLPKAFDYYEIHLSYKMPQKKVVRSRTYRSLQSFDLKRVQERLLQAAKDLKLKIKITVKKAESQTGNQQNIET
jgi:hypothetical protein